MYTQGDTIKFTASRGEIERTYEATFLRMGNDENTYLIMLNGKPTKLIDGKFGLKATRMNGTRFTTICNYGYFTK